MRDGLFVDEARAELEGHIDAIDQMWAAVLTNVKTDILRRLQGLRLLVTENIMANATLLDTFLNKQQQTFAQILSTVSTTLSLYVEGQKATYDQLLDTRCDYFDQE